MIKNVLNRLGVKSNIFRNIFCSTNCDFIKPFSKKGVMQYIIDTTGEKASHFLSIGDRYHTDIAPMLNLGGAGTLVLTPEGVSAFYKDLCNGLMSEGNHGTYYFYVSTIYKEINYDTFTR